MNYGSLAQTGATFALGGVVLNQTWLIAAAVALVVVGAFAIRLGFRRGKTPLDV